MLEFNEENHEYKWDGRVVPSVTQVIQECLQSYYPENESANFGTQFHKVAQYELTGQKYECDDLLKPYIHGLDKFMDDFEINKVLFTEEKMYSEKLGYAGTIDFLGVRLFTSSSKRYLCDWKTGGFSDKYLIQVAAYCDLYEGSSFFSINEPNCYCVQIVENDYKLNQLTNQRYYFNIFQSMLICYKYKQRNNLLKKEKVC